MPSRFLSLISSVPLQPRFAEHSEQSPLGAVRRIPFLGFGRLLLRRPRDTRKRPCQTGRATSRVARHSLDTPPFSFVTCATNPRGIEVPEQNPDKVGGISAIGHR